MERRTSNSLCSSSSFSCRSALRCGCAMVGDVGSCLPLETGAVMGDIGELHAVRPLVCDVVGRANNRLWWLTGDFGDGGRVGRAGRGWGLRTRTKNQNQSQSQNAARITVATTGEMSQYASQGNNCLAKQEGCQVDSYLLSSQATGTRNLMIFWGGGPTRDTGIRIPAGESERRTPTFGQW
jgi:hypothetical protein